MLNKRNVLVGVVILALMLVPAAWSGGGGWQFFEERLGLVESDQAALEDENADLRARVASLESTVAAYSFEFLRIESRLKCVEEGLRGFGKCRQKLLRR